MRGALQMHGFSERLIPRHGLDHLVLPKKIRAALKEIVDLEKARGVLFGAWGFDAFLRKRQGTTALFWGPDGTGKLSAAEALGFELGKPLKVVDLPHLLSAATTAGTQNTGGTPGGFTKGSRGRRTVQSLFNETRLADAILVLDGFTLETGEGGGGGGGGGAGGGVGSLDTVLREMSRFPGVVVLLVTCKSPVVRDFAQKPLFSGHCYGLDPSFLLECSAMP